mgnify:CR=1 FL=1
MRVSVVSDSHGETVNLKKAVEWLVKNENVGMVIHLGDDSDDAKVIDEFKVEVLKVPGVFENHYKNPSIPNRIIREFEGWKVLISHTEKSHENDLPSDLKPEKLVEEKAVDVVLHGHTHIPRIEEKDGVLFINPGHLKTVDKKGYPPSFAIIDFEKESLKVKIIGLDGREVMAKTYTKQ